MELIHLNLDQLHPAKLNARKKGGKEVGDLLPSIKSIGLLQPLLVRPNADGYEIVAGQRRYHALARLAQEGGAEPVPCIVMADNDDARAIEASLAENTARLPMEEIDQFKAFAALASNNVSVSDIAARFGVTERLVQQRLAIANIIDPILNAYRREEVRADTLRALTLATKRQQREWWKMLNDEEQYAPQGHQLKQWLFGGQQIPVANALFEEELYEGAAIADLFGEDRYFDNTETFWRLQNEAIAKLKEDYLADGWKEVEILDIGQHFANWDHRKASKEDGGRVYIRIAHDGEVSVHEGYITDREAKRRETGDKQPGDTAAKPELTQPMQRYLDAHRHAAVRLELLSSPGLVLRIATAQIIAGSRLWTVEAEDERTDGESAAASLAANPASQKFEEERQAIAELLGIDFKDGSICGGPAYQRPAVETVFARLVELDDEAVNRIFAFVVAETLPRTSFLTEALGQLLTTDMGKYWSPDDAFFELWRDKEAINAAVKQIAGKAAADANVAATAKVQKQIVRDCLDGKRKAKVENWLPDYMAFPMTGYTKRGGIDAIELGKAAKAALRSV